MKKKINSDFYFRFKNLLFFPYETFYEYFSLNHNNLSVYPEIWKRYLLDTDYENFIYKDIFQVPEINKDNDNVFWKIANWAQSDFKEDIVVMTDLYLNIQIQKAVKLYVIMETFLDNILL